MTLSRSKLEVQTITSAEALHALRPEWEGLWDQSPARTIFQHPAWVIGWWDQLGSGDLFIVAIRSEGVLVGLAPFMFHVHPITGKREALLIGTGISDYLDFLALAGWEQQVVNAALLELQDRPAWDCADLQQLRVNSVILSQPLQLSLRHKDDVQEVCPVLALAVQTKDPSSVIGPMRQKLLYYRRKLHATTAAAVESANRDNFDELFNALLRLHHARWESKGGAGVLNNPEIQSFHRGVARELLSSGHLRLYGLRINGQIQASFYGYYDGIRTSYYLSGFNPEFGSFSPGVIIVGHAIFDAINEGAREFDFLRGREAYKYLWGGRGQVNYRRRMWHTTEVGVQPLHQPSVVAAEQIVQEAA